MRPFKVESLTQEEQKLIEENYGLIKHFLYQKNQKHLIPKDMYDMCYDYLIDGFLKAVKTYDASRAKFSTWAYKIMTSKFAQCHSKYARQPKITHLANAITEIGRAHV